MDISTIQDESSLPNTQMSIFDNSDIANSYPAFTNNNDSDFKFESDLGLALPFKYNCSDEDLKKSHTATVVRTVESSGKIKMLNITTQSNEGPLQAVENDVLLVLLTMAYEQKNSLNIVDQSEISSDKRVYFTLAEICRRLGLDAGSSGRIKKSINRIMSQKITFKQLDYTPKTNKFVDDINNSSIIVRDGRVRVSNKTDIDTYRELFYVDFDSYIVNKFYKDYFSSIDTKQYLALGTGAQRRLLIFLQSKRKHQGDVFTFDLNEVVQILGIDDHQRKKRTVLSIIEKVHSGLGVFEYTLSEKNSGLKFKSDCANYTVLVKFNSTALVSEYDAFYQSLIDWYGLDNLKSIDILEIDIITLKKEIISRYSKSNSESKKFEYNKKSICVGEFAIDIVLFQIFHNSYKVESFRALCKALGGKIADGVLELPDKYRYFISDRLKEKKLNNDQEKIKELEKIKQRKKEEDEILFESTYKQMFDNFIMPSTKTRNHIETMAIDELAKDGIHSDYPTYKSLLHVTMYNIGKKLFHNGELSNLREKKIVINHDPVSLAMPTTSLFS